MSDQQKPLPDIPPHAQIITTLSTDARHHRKRVIRHLLADVVFNESDQREKDRRVEEWTRAIEGALDDLGRSAGRQDWLAGFRKRREAASNRQHVNQGSFLGPSSIGHHGHKTAAPNADSSSSSSSQDQVLAQMRKFTTLPDLPSPNPVIHHLVLCLTPFGTHIPPADLGAAASAGPGCVFVPGVFSFFSSTKGPSSVVPPNSTILYGLNDWESAVALSERTQLLIVGGSFILHGTTSSQQHQSLTHVLRASIYTHLSLVLEQHLLNDSNIRLKFPRPKIDPSSVGDTLQTIKSSSDPTTITGGVNNNRRSSIRSSLFSFLSRTGFSGHRSSTVMAPAAGGNPGGDTPVELSRNRTVQLPRRSGGRDETPPPRSSLDSLGKRIRRFSIRGGGGGLDERPHSRSPFRKEIQEEKDADLARPFKSVLERIEKSRDVYSTSVDVVFKPPEVLVRLASLEEKEKEKEKEASVGKRLKAKDRCALTTLLGWSSESSKEGKEGSGGKGMLGLAGFVRHQGLSVLVSRHTRQHATSTNTNTSTNSNAGTTTTTGASVGTNTAAAAPTATCGRPRWMTFWYYSKGSSPNNVTRDPSLGEVLHELASTVTAPCEEPGCHTKCGEHHLRFVHDQTRVVVSFGQSKEREEQPKATGLRQVPVWMWESCAVCGVKSKMREMSDGSFLLSFAKYLELLIYSTTIHTCPPLCEHTTRKNPVAGTVDPRFNLTRHFSTDTCKISFTISEATDVFELHIPRLQMCRTVPDKTSHPMCPPENYEASQAHDAAVVLEEERTKLRREIKTFWEGISDYLDKIEEVLRGPEAEAIKKALPRLPSVTDEAYEEMFALTSQGGVRQTGTTISTYLTTTAGTAPSSLSSSTMDDPIVVRVTREDHITTSPTTESDPPALLAAMRYSFQKCEQVLYAQLAQSSVMQLNDIRRSFLAAGRGAQKRVAAWKKKHLSLPQPVGDAVVGELNPREPEWWDKKCHALPGGGVLVQEDDLGSIIAFTLSSSEFLQELSNTTLHRSMSASELGSISRPTTPSANSAVTMTKGYKFFNSTPAQPPLDPDQEGVVWHESETYAAVVTRKEHLRDSASILSIRDMLRSRTPVEPGSMTSLSATETPRPGSSHKAVSPTSPSAWAKADVQLSKEAAGGLVSGLPDTVESAGKVLQELEAITSASSEALRPECMKSDAASVSSVSASTSAASSKRGTSGKMHGVLSASPAISLRSDVTVGAPAALQPPEVPPKDHGAGLSRKASPQPSGPGPGQSGISKAQLQPPPSSFANTLTTSLSYALRLVSSGSSTPRGGPPPPLPVKPHHGLLLTDGNAIEERPHIKYEVMVGKRIKFSCTVYCARQFDALRKRCGVDDIFIKSLSHSRNWAAEGGKSRANFWKTGDDRFVIKTLVNAWNVADLHVLLELGPAYFRYMESTVSKSSVLVKLLGVYTVEVKNFETGTSSKVDLVVMENLFYNRKVDKTFDLKGIQGRKVKPSANDDHEGRRRQTLFDGEWIEDQQKTLMLVRPESKKILREAVRCDAEFLAKMNIMDYSLLLGIDVEGKQLTCGLVDTIGSYTFAKTLEYKAKQGLNSGKDITVVPPAEYEERFVNALEGYFVACPDKWSKPLDEGRIPSGVDQLPSVL